MATVLITAIVLQLVAAVLALRLIRITGAKLAWGVIAVAILLMVVRRLVPLYRWASGDPSFSIDPLGEAIALVISICLVSGLLGIGHYFRASRRVQELLSAEKERLGVTLRSIGDAVITTNAEGRVEFLNPAAESLTGWRAEEAAGRPLLTIFRIVHEKTRQPLEDPVTAVLRSGNGTRIVNRAALVCRDGTERSIADSAAAITGRDGSVVGVVLVFRDIAEQKQAQERLRLNEARLQALVQLNQMTDAPLKAITDFALESAVALTDSTIGYLAFLNEDESVLTMHSWSRSAMEECAIIDKPILYPVASTGLWGEAVRQRQPVITNDYQAANPLKKGYPSGHVTVLRHMNAPIFDGQRMVIVAGVGNKAAPYDESDVRQLTLLMQGMWQLLKRRESQEALRKARDELEVHVQQRTAELGLANRELVARAETLAAASQAAEAASRAKSTFLANMSHEIRTPLNAVIGMTELVLRTELTGQQREFLHTVRESGEALLAIIEDILDFSKIEAGKLVLECCAFDLRESLGDTVKSFALRAHQQGLELTCFIQPEVPRRVAGDYARLRQVVVNLIGNALKFTEAGEVSLEVRREAAAEKEVLLHFIVSDTGIGIPAEKQDKVFEMFEQVDPSITRRHGGTGLGLAIVKRLIDAMGGQVWLESEVGRGSRFHFRVRLALADDEPPTPPSPEVVSLHGLRALIVDDNATNRRILDEILRSWRMQPVTVCNAAEALHCARDAHQRGVPFRLVLTDAHMPETDGFMLARQIKDDCGLSSTVIMMLTSGDRADDFARCAELGIASYLVKPVKQSELLEAIESALGFAAPKAKWDQPPTPSRVAPLRVLLAEDSVVNQKLASALLESCGHKVTVANNGREALEALARQDFDLVLMDVQMPEMDGLEASRKIRSGEAQTGKHVPIIAMTAHALKDDRQRCLSAGMDGYISKPIHVQELLNAIEGWATSAPPPAGAQVAERGGTGRIDWAAALSAAGDDEELLRSVAKEALTEIPRLMEAIRQALAAANVEPARFAAHTLKGSLRCFGPTKALELVTRLERLGREGDLAGAAACLASLEAEIALVIAELQDYAARDQRR